MVCESNTSPLVRNVFVMPKRPPRSNECYALDKDLSGAGSPSDALDLAMAKAEVMDAPNWANLLCFRPISETGT